MKDFNTGKEIDMQGMLDMLKYAEEAEKIVMIRWVTEHTCGTAGCLVGTYIMRKNYIGATVPSLRRDTFSFYHDICFGLSEREKEFLFIVHHSVTRESSYKAKAAASLTKDEAIARLRKFIYYKLRKAELLEDYQASRRIEGNQFFTLAYANS